VADCNQLAGWAWDSTQPNTSINVDIYDGTTFVATVLASNFRQDLYNAGYGNGNHGYSFSTPASLKNNQYHYIYVKYGGTSLLLNNSDQPLYCSATSTGYQYYYSDTFPSINAAAWSQHSSFTPKMHASNKCASDRCDFRAATVRERSLFLRNINVTLWKPLIYLHVSKRPRSQLIYTQTFLTFISCT